MEITRQLKTAFNAQTEAPAAAPRKSAPAEAGSSAPAAQGNAQLPLEQLQEAIGQLPDIDLDRVAAIKLALQRGEIPLDNAALSRAMLAYHNGSDA